MKKILLIALLAAPAVHTLKAQVTQISSNTNLSVVAPMGNNKTILVSDTDSLVWSTDGTAAGTILLSPNIASTGNSALLNDKIIFSGVTPANGEEMFVTDGTVAGTTLLVDIYPGTTGSEPGDDVAVLNGFLYFTANSPTGGRELWRTNGTAAGTSLVRDIIPGATGSTPVNLFSNGTYLLFNAQTPSNGVELYISNGTNAGTMVLKDISPGAMSSNAESFTVLNNTILFMATTVANGKELWKTDGTPGGTVLVKDINPGPAGLSGFLPSTSFFYVFNNRAFFIANDGTNGEEIWSTDGTEANTSLLKNIHTDLFTFTFLFNSIKVGNKFFFTTTNGTDRNELWQSDGTTAGTTLFKSFAAGTEVGFPFILSPDLLDPTNSNANNLFQGNSFFFAASTVNEGYELWISNGTDAGTRLVKNINPGAADGVRDLVFAYSTTALYFSANDGVNGNELWKSDGTTDGTVLVANINPGAASSNPSFGFLSNGKLIFQATNGDNMLTDVYVLNESLIPLPVTLSSFTVASQASDALLQWSTAQEINTDKFTIQRSDNGTGFTDIAVVKAIGNTSGNSIYSYVDADVRNGIREKAYYRLLITDKDGKFKTSGTIFLKFGSARPWSVKLVNNPVRDQLNIQVNDAAAPVLLMIKDINGRTVYSRTIAGSGQVSLPVQQLQKGVYVLTAQSDNTVKSAKFIRQ